MSSSAVVGDFNPLKKNTLREVELKQRDAKNGFGFQGFEKRLGDSIVSAVTFAAHAAQNSMLRKQLSKGLVSVLNSAIGMKNQPAVNASLIRKAGMVVSWVFMMRLNDHPTISRPHKSITLSSAIYNVN